MSVIKSIRETFKVDYDKPDPEKIDKFIADLQESEEAMNYLKNERGFTEKTIEHFQLGYDKKRDAISIPIFKNKELINIKYRLLNPKRNKYSSERGAENWLYNERGVDYGKAKGTVLVVEGEFDLMACWQVGIKNVVSPALGKNSYGVWIELLDNIPKVFLAYDNDKGGKETSAEIADRLGVDKCYEVIYPDDIKDANEFFQKHTVEDYKNDLIGSAKPFYKHQFKGLGEVIESFRKVDNSHYIETRFIPDVKIGKDWLITAVAESGAGKTTWALNVVHDLVNRDNRVLILPIENGVDFVGKRLLNIIYDKTDEQLIDQSETEWNHLIKNCIDKEIYFARPTLKDTIQTIEKAKRLFNVNFVLIDLLDLLVSESTSNEFGAVKKIIHELKNVCMDNDITVLGILQFRKDQSSMTVKKKRTMQDINGSADYYTQPQCVIILDHLEESGELEVKVAKNKGRKSTKNFAYNLETGKLGAGELDKFVSDLQEDDIEADALDKF